MATVATFLETYPEFANAVTDSAGLIEAHLADATEATNADVMGTRTEEAIKLKTAITLMQSPWARSLRLEEPKALPLREQRLRDMQTSQAFGLRVFV